MPPVVRPARLEEVPVIAEFNIRLAEESEGKTLDRDVLEAGVAAGLADPRKALYFIAEEAGEPAGQVMITTEWSDWRNGWIWWIQSVYVRPELRRRGIFRALFQHVERLAAADPLVAGLRLYVERENALGLQTYRSLGMQPTGYVVYEKLKAR